MFTNVSYKLISQLLKGGKYRMAKTNKIGVIGQWAFLIGVIIAVIVGLLGLAASENIALVLMVIGIIVGLLNVSDKESMHFLMSGVVLIIASGLGKGAITEISIINLPGVLTALMAIFVPATIIVAVKNVFSIAKN